MNSIQNPIRDKSYAFAKKIVHTCQNLYLNKEFVLSKQLLKSGTSIAANIEEAQQSQSRKDFLSKMQISLKEAYESRFWIRLLGDTHLIEAKQKEEHLKDITEIINILAVIVSRTRTNIKINSEK